MRDTYLTGCGAFLPGVPLGHAEVAQRFGTPLTAVARRILAANGIRTRHLALDERGEVAMLNEELAAEAVQRALEDRGLSLDLVGMLAAGTTQGDVLVPGFASMVHGRLGGGPMELLTAAGVCASGIAAFVAADRAIRVGAHATAVVVGSELASRAMRERRYAAAERPRMDTEFLRWTLSDGAGAVVLETHPRADGPSLRVDWTHLVSYAHERPVCMSAGLTDGGWPSAGQTWLDVPSAAVAERDGMLRLRQDVSLLPDVLRLGVREFLGLVHAGKVDPAGIDHLLCHYSAENLRTDLVTLMREADLMVAEDRWFTNLHTCGNTGAASIFVMLAEAWQAGRFRPGQKILLAVPESGRFSYGFVHLTCVGPAAASVPVAAAVPVAATPSPIGEPADDDPEIVRWTVLELARVWADFERRLHATPLVRRIETRTATLDDYRGLLVHLRQQVVEGGRWISRAASNFSADRFALRSAAITHAAEEHRDFQLLERDYCATGGALADIRSARKNIGSEALSAYVFHQASQPDPVDLLGAMFIIEGLGTRLTMGWARQLQVLLGLSDDQVSFLRYHGGADDEHVAEMVALLRSETCDRATAERIVRTAEVVARLYALQLSEVDTS